MYKLFLVIFFIFSIFSIDVESKELFKDQKLSYEVYLEAEDSKGNLWFTSTNNGILQYDGKNWWFYSLGKDYVYSSIIIDKKDNVWIIVRALKNNPEENEEIYTVKNGNLALLYKSPSTNITFMNVNFDNDNTPYFLMTSTDFKKKFVYTIKDNKFVNNNELYKLDENKSIHLFIDSKNRKWFYFDDDINMVDQQGNLYYFNSMSLPDDNRIYKNDYRCEVLFEDKKGNIWVKANNALAVYNTQNKWDYYTRRDGIEFQYDIPVRIIENTKNDVLISSANGIFKFKNNKLEPYFPKYFNKSSIMDIAVDQNNDLWVSTFSSLEMLKGEKLIIWDKDINPGGREHFIKSIFVDKRNVKWFTFTFEQEFRPLVYNNKEWYYLFRDGPFQMDPEYIK